MKRLVRLNKEESKEIFIKIPQRLRDNNETCSQCYKTFFGGNLENRDFPQAETARIVHFKRNQQS